MTLILSPLFHFILIVFYLTLKERVELVRNGRVSPKTESFTLFWPYFIQKSVF